MRRVKMLSFKDLVNENKKELLRNDKEIEKIEKKIDEKYARRADLSQASS